MGLALTASVVLKLTYYRKYFRDKHEGENRRGLKKVAEHVSDVGDVFAHTLTTFSQFASVWFANSVEFFGDRYFPELSFSK